MAFELSYAGIALTVPDFDPTIEADIAVNIPTYDTREFLPPRREFLGKNIHGLAFARPAEYPALSFNQWFYPVGMTRWSVFRFLAIPYQVNELTKLCYRVNLTNPVAQPFKLRADCNPRAVADPAVDTITTNLFMLPPRPISPAAYPLTKALVTDQGLYVVTLVDERYYLQFENATTIRLTTADSTGTWDDLITVLRDLLNITLTWDAVDAVYGTPAVDSPLYTNYESAAYLLDAVAANVGCVVVRAYDGSYAFVKFADALADIKAMRLANDLAKRTAKVSGGLVLDQDDTAADFTRKAVLPTSVTVTFPKADSNGVYLDSSDRGWILDSYGDVYAKTVLLTNLNAGTYPWSTTGGHDHDKPLHDTAIAKYDNDAGTGDPTNKATLDALALRMATDYFQSLLIGIDEVYPGVWPMAPTLGVDVLYSYRRDTQSTRVQGRPWNWGADEFQHGPAGITGTSDESCTQVLRDVNCVNNQLVKDFIYITGDFSVSNQPCGIGPPIKPGLGGGNDGGGIKPVDPILPPNPGGGGAGVGGGVTGSIGGGGGTSSTSVQDCMAYAIQSCMAYFGWYNPTCIQAMFWSCYGKADVGTAMPGGVQSFVGMGGGIGPPVGPAIGIGPNTVYLNQIPNLDGAAAGSIVYFDTTESFATLKPSDGQTLVWASGIPTAATPAGSSNVSTKIWSDYADAATTHTDGTEDTLNSVTVAAGTLAANGDVVEFCVSGVFSGSGSGNVRIQVYFDASGTTQVFDSGTFANGIPVVGGNSWTIKGQIVRESSSVVRIIAAPVFSTTATQPAQYKRVTGLTLSASTVLKTTGIASGIGSASGDITFKMGTGLKAVA